MTTQQNVLDALEADIDGETVLTVKTARKDGQTLLYVQCSEKFENLIKTETVQNSSSWGKQYVEGDDTGYDFYKKSSINSSLQSTYGNGFDEYGHSKWYMSSRGNVAVLRTKGLSDGKYFVIDQPLTKRNLKKLQEDIKQAGQNLIDAYLKDVAYISEIKEIEVDKERST